MTMFGPRRRTALAGLLLAGGAMGPLMPVLAASATPDPTQPCRIEGVPTELRCGQVTRPLDPDQPQGRQIEVRYVVVPAMARNKQPDPVLMLAGGPGQSAIQVAPRVLPRLSRLGNRRDLVFIDQRGTGRSAALDCADESRLPVAQALDPQAQLQRLRQCRGALEKLPHGDLRFYTTTIAMQDFDAVRQQLGAAQWNLVGASYGTRAALEYQRQFPERVRRTVLDGVAPPDMVLPASFSTDGQAALDAAFEACEREAACQQRFPRLRQDWAALLQSLPRAITLQHPLSGEPERLTMTRELLLRAVRTPLYAPPFAAALPAAIDAAAKGRFEAISGLSGALGSGKSLRLAMGMHFSVVCAEDLPRLAGTADQPGADFGRSDAELYSQVCQDWPRGKVPEAFYTVPPAKTPVLVLSGGADPATPPRHGERVTRALGPQALHVVVAEAGHGVMGLGCMNEVLYRFIDHKDNAAALKVDAGCASKIPRPNAFLPIRTGEAQR
jgi:pimeloyl-ACP methyl ester carboxylesterase